MLKSFTVENFRCLKHNALTDLRRINILVGKNASGKTALMESIKLGLDAVPATVPWLEGSRGIQFFIRPNINNEQFQSILADIFHDFNTDLTISTQAVDSTDRIATLKVKFEPGSAITVQPQIGFINPVGGSGQAMTAAASIVPLAFQRRDLKGQVSTLLIAIQANGQLMMQPGNPIGPACAFFGSSGAGNPNENANWFSELSITKRTDDVIAAIQKHFPFIKDVSSEAPSGINSLWANIPSLSRKVPLSLISGGINRLFTVILAVVRNSRGVVLIDEVENGVYYDQYEMLWRTLYELAVAHDTQLFVSSHSWDCLKHLTTVMKNHEEDFKLLRLKKENGSSKVEEIKGDLVEAALEQNVEIR